MCVLLGNQNPATATAAVFELPAGEKSPRSGTFNALVLEVTRALLSFIASVMFHSTHSTSRKKLILDANRSHTLKYVSDGRIGVLFERLVFGSLSANARTFGERLQLARAFSATGFSIALDWSAEKP